MELVIGVLLGLAIAGGAVALTRRRRRPAAALAAPVDPLAEPAGADVGALGVGAVVAFEGRDFVVRGSLELDEDGYIWWEHHLDDLEVRRWISVDTNDGTDVQVWEAAAGAEGLEPSGPEVVWDGATYKRVEEGRARYRSIGTTGLPASGDAWYADFRHASDETRWLAFERWSAEGSWEVSAGRTVPAEHLDVFPAGRTGGL